MVYSQEEIYRDMFERVVLREGSQLRSHDHTALCNDAATFLQQVEAIGSWHACEKDNGGVDSRMGRPVGQQDLAQ